MKDPQNDSLHRRLLFSAKSRYFTDWLFSKEPLYSFCKLTRLEHLARVPDMLANFAFDLGECFRTRSLVPHIADVRATVLNARVKFLQPPRYQGFTYDAENHSMVGMHLGIDLVKHGGKYYPLEFNLDAAVRAERRILYSESIDPIYTRILGTAKELNFKKVVLFNSKWDRACQDEIRKLSSNSIEVSTLAYPPGKGTACALPPRLESNTFYVVFHTRHIPLNEFVHNKISSAKWFEESINVIDEGERLIGNILTSEELFVTGFNEVSASPNLVVKFAGVDAGAAVLMAKVRGKQEAKDLGLDSISLLNRHFRMRPYRRFVNRINGNDRILFQQYIVPDIDAEGKAQKYRIHLLVAPLQCRFLSVHKVKAGIKLPLKVDEGIIQDPSAFLVNYSHNSGYCRVNEEQERELEKVADQLGQIISHALSKRFEVKC